MTPEPGLAPLPLVSVLMPAYNHEKYVEASVRSIWAQTYPNTELIVVDDGSRDETPAILRRLAAESPIPMRVEVQSNSGTTRTMNRAFSLARGEYITLTASDDLYLPHHVQTLIDALRNAPPGTGLAFGDLYVLDERGQRLGRYLNPNTRRDGDIYEDLLLRRWMVPALAAMMPAAVFREIGGYNESSQVDDLELLLRITRKYQVVYVDSCLAEYRGHHSPDQLTRQITRLVPDWCRLFEDGLRDYPRSSEFWWRRSARGQFYYRIGHCFYNTRDLAKARLWLIRALLLHPFQPTPWNLLIRSLAGRRLLDAVSSIKARRHSRPKP